MFVKFKQTQNVINLIKIKILFFKKPGVLVKNIYIFTREEKMSSNFISDFRNNINNNDEEMNNDDNTIQEELFRFTQDLEFVQLLSNPNYLECK